MMYQKLLSIILMGSILTSCAAYSSSASHSYLTKYQEAEERYEAKDYDTALALFQEVLPLLRGKREIIQANFHQAYAYFYRKEYKLSAQCFKHFYKTYPKIAPAEEAMYMHGYALSLCVSDVELDQSNTEEAIKILNNYLAKYPTGTYLEVALQQIGLLKNKLAHKVFLNAQLYYQISCYQAALVVLANFQQNFAASPYQEEATYLKVAAQYKLAEESKKEERESKLRSAIVACHEFLDHYPNSHHRPSVQKIYRNILVQINKIIKPKVH